MNVYMVENRMVNDSCWWWKDKGLIEEEKPIEEKLTKFVSWDRKTEVMFDEAYEYACSHARREAEPDEEEFSDEEFVEWFFSGSWMKE